MLGRYECLTNTTSISQDMSTTCNQPSVHLYPSKYFNSIHTGDIVRGHFKVFQIRWRKKSFSTISQIWIVIMLTQSWPFPYFMSLSLSTALSTDTWGVGETKTQVSSSQYCVHPWQLLPMMKLVAHWRHTGGNLKNCFRNMDSLSERNQWRKCSVNQARGKLGANWGQTGGKLGAT